MAGTLTISTLSDGTNSTSSTNCIQGSAKAWVNFNATGTPSIRASYNVSSVVLNSTGFNQVNFTNAFADTNYVFVATCSNDGANRSWVQFDGNNNSNAGQQQTTNIKFYTGGVSNVVTEPFIWVACFR